MQEECNLMTYRSKSRAHNYQVIAVVSMYLVSSGFEEWIHLFVRETLPGVIVIRVEPTSSM